MRISTQRTRNSRLATRALTLVEMLIGMAITLVMMAAVVNLFANLGSGIRIRNASMELGGELRTARARLFKDLAGATCAARPKLPSDDHDDGYIELIEGQYSDKLPSALVEPANIDADDGDGNFLGLQQQTSIIPRGNGGGLVQWTDGNENGIVDSTAERDTIVSTGSGLGDFDDILALTVRSESEPFVGQWFNANTNQIETIQSDLAEVIWFAVQNPADGSLGEPGMRTVYRKVLLIAPWVAGNLEPPTGSLNVNSRPADLLNFYRRNDISIRRVESDSTNDGTVDVAAWVPNTLSDLTKRENRFAHSFSGIAGNPYGYPFAMYQLAIRARTYEPTDPAFVITDDFGPLRPYGLSFENPSTLTAEQREIVEEREGEDVMLNDVLAFDLRVFDPGAPLVVDPANPGLTLEPSDAGSPFVFSLIPSAPTPIPPINIPAANVRGFGAFVDLGWAHGYTGIAGATAPRFNLQHQPGWTPTNDSTRDFTSYSAVYDTWPYHYEDDGIDQDGIHGPDQGTDGLDNVDPTYAAPFDQLTAADQAINGVDDPGERETSPPYDVPLRAMQVKIRVFDRDTRQIREATVTRNFVPQ